MLPISSPKIALLVILATAVMLTACGGGPAPEEKSGPLQVVATTTIVGDAVARVGGDAIALSVLLPVGTDPHSFDPTPQDIARVADADVIFANGAGLEAFLEPLLANASSQAEVVSLSDGIELLAAPQHADGEDEDDHGDADPHVWTDPQNVILWVEKIAETLQALDPDQAQTYVQNAAAYRQELEALDEWIRQQVDAIPPEQRRLVTDHAVFGYFARAYGFEQVGALIPGYSTLASPSARDLSALEDAIRQLGVGALFVGNTVNPALAERVAADTGVKLVFLYTGSLSAPDGEAGTYLDYMRYNTQAIVDALRGD
ncbi:MAG: zinc ABC transporter substrate-binding protein [Anaerolineae bacterium]|nr:MAG: zinc ABC transporter substrate-binding protein [Anaerolineae bacterium]